jgi:ATP-dependent helicase Lhr and Lhr-like helicase
MTNSPASGSESTGFHLLDLRIQRWIWNSGWTELRDAQEQAIPLLLDGTQDVIIAATTASGKTEAAFFPILTRLAQMPDEYGLALYISPLKALINDQFRRLDELAALLEIPVTPWHGDINQQRKSRFMKNPRGCLLITPESLEALLARQGHSVRGLFAGLRYVVVDEVHAFMGTERGKQLQSLLNRVEQAIGRTVCRVGLSATLGDKQGAARFLRPDGARPITTITSQQSDQQLLVLVKGVVEGVVAESETVRSKNAAKESVAKRIVADHLFQVLRGSSNLVFPNSRSEVEFYSDYLRLASERAGVPNEFWPHHGNLSKEIREETELALKQTERPVTAICTSTLELGIDIGPVKSVVQIGPPPSVASLRQRLGRSGRRKGEPMILRAYCVEDQLTAKSGISDHLRTGLATTIAMIRLLTRGWYEPVSTSKLHGSTLVQQTLSLLAQYGGLQTQTLWELLCGSGPFSQVSRGQFLALLRKLGEKEIVFQDTTGLLLLAPQGERITQHYSFYASFSSDEEFRIVAGSRTLGSMPITRPLTAGSFLIFAGRRWQVVSVSQEDLVIIVQPASGGAVPGFDGAMGADLHDRVRQEMREVLRTDGAIPFLDATAQFLLEEARANYRRFDLDHEWIIQSGAETQIFLWRGDSVNDTLLFMLHARGLSGIHEGVCISLRNTTVESIRRELSLISDEAPVDPIRLAAEVKNPIREKWDHLLPPELLNANFASSYLNVYGVMAALKAQKWEIDERRADQPSASLRGNTKED